MSHFEEGARGGGRFGAPGAVPSSPGREEAHLHPREGCPRGCRLRARGRRPGGTVGAERDLHPVLSRALAYIGNALKTGGDGHVAISQSCS